MKRQVIEELKQELHRMEVSSQPHEFEKHLYAMERLLNLLKADVGTAAPAQPVKAEASFSEHDRMMFEQMGGKVSDARPASKPEPLPAERLDTDDGFGNGDSLFDF